MLKVRLWHSYLAVLIAPSVLFFALTGALQLFSLHEAHGGYQPALLIEKLGRLHKDQVFAPDEHHHGPPPASAAPTGAGPAGPSAGESAEAVAGTASGPPGKGPGDDDDDAAPWPTMALKYYFLLVALGLITSTSLGLWIAFTRQRRPALAWGLLLTGIVVPLLLLIV
jgi:hypothetical protein